VFLAREVSAVGVDWRSSPTCGEDQPRYSRHPSSTDCQLYVACVTGPDGRYVPVLMRCLLGLQWDDSAKMCVARSSTCYEGHVTHNHVTSDLQVTADHVADGQHRRHQQLRHSRPDDVIY